MSELLRIVNEYSQAPSRPRALATILTVEGSHYRRPGACALLCPRDGKVVGSLSGGCLEGDLLERTVRVVETQSAEIVTYDTSSDGDALFGLGLGCGGFVTILLEPLAQDVKRYFSALHEALRRRVECRTILVVDSLTGNPIIPRRTLFAGNECVHNSIEDEAFLPAAQEAPDGEFIEPNELSLNGAQCFVFSTQPPVHVVVCGCGPETPALARFAIALGWEMTVIDRRGSALEVLSQFASIKLKRGCPEEFIDKEILDGRTAVLALSHKLTTDVSLVSSLKSSSCGYIGLLGSRTRKRRVLEEAKVMDSEWPELYAPTGLDIGADTPAEIALAIVSEIQMVMGEGRGGSLRSGADLPRSCKYEKA